jgi:hypothetical protein
VKIANSISTLGSNLPLLIGKDNVVVDGESRLEAAKLLRLSSVPRIRVDHLGETEQRLLRLAVNRLAEKGCWDVGELKAEFEELIIADAPIEISGFGSDEIDQIVIGRDHDESEAAVLAPLPGALAIARVGDLFLLGPHRVICGNATDPDLVKRLMRTDVTRMVFTDAPLPVAMDGHVTLSDHRERAQPPFSPTLARPSKRPRHAAMTTNADSVKGRPRTYVPASPALWGAAPPRRLPTSPKEFHPAPQHRLAQAKFLGHRPDRAAARSHKIDRLQLRGFLTATTFHSL